MPWVKEMNKLSDFLVKRQERITAEEESREREAKRIEEDRDIEIIRHKREKFSKKNCKLSLNLRRKSWKWRRRQEQLKLSFPS